MCDKYGMYSARHVSWPVDRTDPRTAGNLLCIRALGQTMVVIGDARSAVVLLEKWSVNYADRPELKMVELCVLSLSYT